MLPSIVDEPLLNPMLGWLLLGYAVYRGRALAATPFPIQHLGQHGLAVARRPADGYGAMAPGTGRIEGGARHNLLALAIDELQGEDCGGAIT